MSGKFYRAGSDLGVVGLFVTLTDDAGHRNHALGAQTFGNGKILRGEVAGVKHHLENAFPVTQVDEDHASHVTLGQDPATAGLFGAFVFFTQKSAVNGSFHETDSFLFNIGSGKFGKGNKKSLLPNRIGTKQNSVVPPNMTRFRVSHRIRMIFSGDNAPLRPCLLREDPRLGGGSGMFFGNGSGPQFQQSAALCSYHRAYSSHHSL